MTKIDLVINKFSKYLSKEEVFDFYYQNERYKFALSKIDNFFSWEKLGDINILEIGAGALHFACLCSMMGWKVTAVEANSDLSSFFSNSLLNKRINVKERVKEFNIKIFYGKNILYDKLLLENNFDCILLMEMIEHFNDNPLNAFSNIFPLLKKGGLLYITTPNVHYFTLKLQFMLNISIFANINIILEQPTFYYHHKLYSLRELHVLINRLNNFL